MANNFNAKRFLKTLTSQPGVYRMYDKSGCILYIGKAKNLKRRIESYFRPQLHNRKIESLVKNINHIDVTITNTETEALLIEHSYIKLYKPRYNVLLRDDKYYPFILLSNDKHPRLMAYRGPKNMEGDYFGPFPNGYAVKKTLALLQTLFPIRQCENNIYNHRSRACLQYQIGRCLGPCIEGLVNDKEYQQQVEYVRLFLLGKDQEVIKHLIKRMEIASHKLNFEAAAQIRDQIKAVRYVLGETSFSNTHEDFDVISISFKAGLACIYTLFIRHGRVLNDRTSFSKPRNDTELQEIIKTFIIKLYLQEYQIYPLPKKVLLNFPLSEKKNLVNFLNEKIGKKFDFETKWYGSYSRYIKMAYNNSETALLAKVNQHSMTQEHLYSIGKLLNINQIKRIECFDISHTMGDQTIASCVVFEEKGPVPTEYRRYSIKNITPGDDYAAMIQVLQRRYGKALKTKKIPDVVILDGGRGHLNIAKAVFNELNVSWDKSSVVLLSIAKNKDRKMGFEKIFLESNKNGMNLTPDSPILHAIQHIRNTAHNHAITGHRNKRDKVKNTSSLELIKGIGPKRRRLLLKYMGGLQSLRNASAEEIAQVPGISSILAKKVFNALKC